MAGWDRDTDGDHDVLVRIVALLVSLANLADAAAGLRTRRRREVLGFLMPGEAAARALIAGMAFGAPNLADEQWQRDASGGAEDAALLAATFRVLALALYTMLGQADRLPAVGAARRAAQRTPAVGAERRYCSSPVPDTS